MIAVTTLGRPGVGTLSNSKQTFVFADGEISFLPGFGVIDANNTRDPSNSPNVSSLQPGLLLGRLTASPFRYAASIIGLTTAAAAAAATTLNVSPATAVELARRTTYAGLTTFLLIGPPAAAGTVATQVVTFSAINQATGAITVGALGAAAVAGSIVAPNDGSAAMLTIVPDGYGISFDAALTPIVEFPRVPIGGVLDTAKIINYPTDASLKAYVRNQMNLAPAGKFVFNDIFQ